MSEQQDLLWQEILQESQGLAAEEPVLASFYHASILSHQNLASALAFHIAAKLGCDAVPAMMIRQLFEDAFGADPQLIDAIAADLKAYRERDAACDKYSIPLLYFKGFHALQAHRLAHSLWRQQRLPLALYLQNRNSMIFDVDIHPAATIGRGIMIDHATGVVVGETASIGNNVSLLHSVTLGGSGCGQGRRHPRVGDGVLISAGAKLLGDIIIGDGAKIAAGSLVLEDVPAHMTVAGVPAKIVGRPSVQQPALDMNQQIGGQS